MDKKESSNVAELSIPKSDVNTVLSSAGNGLTIGGIPLIGTEFYHRWVKNSNHLPRNLEKACIFTAVAGCAIGAVVGVKEAKEINRYRNALRSELIDLRAQSDENARKIESWSEKMAQRDGEKSDRGPVI